MAASLRPQHESDGHFLIIANRMFLRFFLVITVINLHPKVKLLGLSFKNSRDLHGRAELLPSGPRWRSMHITTSHPTKHPVYLYWRDALECIAWIFNHPSFHNQLDLIPERLYTSNDKDCRLYTEWMTGNEAWYMQVSFYDKIYNLY